MKTHIPLALCASLILLSALAPVRADEANAFATGNMGEAVKAMDANHDGTVSREEFLRYQGEQFDRMPGAQGMVSDANMLKYLKGLSSH